MAERGICIYDTFDTCRVIDGIIVKLSVRVVKKKPVCWPVSFELEDVLRRRMHVLCDELSMSLQGTVGSITHTAVMDIRVD